MIRFLQRLSVRILLAIGVMMLLMAGGVIVYWILVIEPIISSGEQTKADLLVTPYARLLEESVAQNDREGLENILNRLLLLRFPDASEQMVLALRVVFVNGEEIVLQGHSEGPQRFKFSSELALFSPDSHDFIGTLKLHYNDHLYRSLVSDTRQKLLWGVGCGLALLLLLQILLTYLLGPFRRLADHLGDVDFHKMRSISDLGKGVSTEVRQVGDAINNLLQRLNHSQLQETRERQLRHEAELIGREQETELKHMASLRAAKDYTENVIQTVPSILITVDEISQVISANRSLERFGLEYEPIDARRFVNALKNEIATHLESGQIQVRELVIAGIRDVAARYTFNAVVSSIPSDSGRRAVLLSITDVSEQKKAEQEIIRSLKEKEVLLREIHHRVKNNMQVISSLLRLQTRHTDDQKSLGLLQESQNRIIAMALVHEKLYRSTDFVNLDLKDYINTLISGLRRSYGTLCKRIVFKVQVGAVHLGVDSLIPCGLIVNELVTNSIKYAFPNGGRGTIVIRIDALPDNGVQLEVRDDGVGLPANFDARRTRSLGLLLVTMLAESQLCGKVRIEGTGGTGFIIVFREDGAAGIPV